jgi:hypothetical protein
MEDEEIKEEKVEPLDTLMENRRDSPIKGPLRNKYASTNLVA